MEDSWKTLVRLCHNRDLLFDGETPRYTKPQRAEISSVLSRSIPRFKSMTDIVSVLSDKSLYPFLEFLIPLCEDLRDRSSRTFIREFSRTPRSRNLYLFLTRGKNSS
jgi:hypothetical protein